MFSTSTTIQPGEIVSIYGTNLATTTMSWNGDFPGSLGGTSVKIDGIAGYLLYVSPGLIDLQAPDDPEASFPVTVPVTVTTSQGTATSTVTLGQFGPSFSLLDSKHVAGIIIRTDGSGAYDRGLYDIIGPTGNSLGYPTVAARAGDTVELFGVGFGPTTPSVPAGQAFFGAAKTTNPVSVLMNNVNVTPAFAGLSSAVLYQINLTIPPGLGTGDFPLVATVGGVQTPSNVVISLDDNAPNSACTDIGGNWNASETGSETMTLDAAGEAGSATDAIAGSGLVNFAQTGCSIQLNPIPQGELLGTASSLIRTGMVTGNNVSLTGQVALPAAVASAEEAANSGLDILSINVGANLMTASGQLSGNVITLNETGTLSASGTFTYEGEGGSYTFTATTSSTGTFTSPDSPALKLPGGAASASSFEIHVVPDRAFSSTGRERVVITLLRAAFRKALGFGDR